MNEEPSPIDGWWLDYTPWPGPADDDPFWEFYQIARQWGVTANAMASSIEHVMTAYGRSLKELPDPVFKLPAKPAPKSVGPRSGSQFDHHGRRRW